MNFSRYYRNERKKHYLSTFTLLVKNRKIITIIATKNAAKKQMFRKIWQQIKSGWKAWIANKMITAKEAYEIIKESSKMPITYLIETGESFLSSTKEYILYHHNNGCPDYYRDDGEKQEIIHRWSIIEQNLYADIRLIIDNEYIDYPPIVLNEFDDSFFSIKPFMIRNGWTTNNVCRTWVRSTENLRNTP